MQTSKLRLTLFAILLAATTRPAPAAPAPAAPAPATAAPAAQLRVYFADVEGGQSTLFVTPSGESLLVDTGWPGFEGRDADRIVALAKLAGISRIDNVLVTHYHTDHVGGLPQLAARIPIGRFIDHGENRETADPVTVSGYNAYQKLLAADSPTHYAHLTVKPGDVLPVKGVHIDVVAADGEVIARPLSGAGAQNTACDASPLRDPEASENDRSIGLRISFGKLRVLDLGDLTWARERPLMCPIDKLGKIDVYIVTHHGMDRSGSPAVIDAIAPRVAIMDNGATKGGTAAAFDTLQKSPRLKDLWQLHTAEHSDAAHNVSDARIANLAGVPDAGNWLELIGRADGSFSVKNGRTGDTVDYPAP